MSLWDRVLGGSGRSTVLEEAPQLPLAPTRSERLSAPSERAAGVMPRGLVAAAAPVTVSQSRAISAARQKWQRDAWIYRDAIGEIRYGMRFLANASSMITLLGAEVGDDGEEPIDLDASTLPPQLVADVRAIVDDLLAGRGGGHLLGPGVENFETVGECYLLGRIVVTDQGEEVREWSIRSRDEIEVKPDAIYLKTGERGAGEKLDPDAELIRLWAPHPRFTEWADAPMRALLDSCEELLLVTRSVRAAARNRLAGNGLLLMSSGLAGGPPQTTPDGRLTGQAQGSTFADDLQRTMITPIADETAASAVVPPIVWGDPEDLAAVRHLTFDRPLDAKLVDREERALRRIATGLDVPVEVITGLADVNHWTAWQIDDSSFRHHVAPIVGTFVDSLTVGYLRPALLKLGHSWADVRRVMLWRDPSRLVQRPNRAADALQAWDRNALSDRVLLESLGFDPVSDKPDEAELLQRLALRRGAMDGAITESLLRLGFGPLIDVLRTTPPGQITSHTGVDVQDSEASKPPGALPGAPAAIEAPAPGSSSEGEGDDAGDDDAGTPGSPIGDPQATVAAAEEESGVTDRSRRLSRRLAQINRSLFDRLIVAADDALEQALTRAGNRIRGKANGTEHAAAVRGVQASLVASALGRPVVASLGLEETELLADTFAGLRTKFDQWTVDATEEAFDVVAELLGLDRSNGQVQRAVGELRDAFEEGRVAAWALLEQGLTAQAAELLYDPDPSADEFGEIPSTTVRPGLIRGALATVGGVDTVSTGGLLTTGLAAIAGSFVPSLTSGQLLTGYLRANGAEVEEYEWTYGISARPFPPHKALDGVIFRGFDDPQLSTGRFPGYSWVGPSLVPGDHDGCHCDAGLIFTDGARTRQAAQEIGDAAYREQNPGRPLPTRKATTDPNLYLEE